MAHLRLPRRGPKVKPRRHWPVALLLCLASTGILSFAGTREGFTRDEGYYFDAAELYWGWYGELGDDIAAGKPLAAFHRASIDRWFGYNHEHPVLMKTLYGFSWRLFHKCHCLKQGGRHPVAYTKPHRTLNLLGEAEAMRLPADLFGGIMVALAYLFGARAFSRRAGAVAAVLSLAAPRIFFNAELSCFDAPMATTWLAVVYCYWRSLEDKKWGLATGIAFGLALATKHNAFFLPFVLLAHYLYVHRQSLRRFRLPPIPPTLLYMALLGPLIEFAHWPWMWFDTVTYKNHHFGGRFPEYLAFHLNHVYYNMEFLGTNYNKPPFPKSYAFVMTLLTAPVTTLALAIGGAIAMLREWLKATRPDSSVSPTVSPGISTSTAKLSTSPGLLVGLNALFPLAIITFTGAPIFGATKHWLPAIPFIALLAGFGLDRLSRSALAALKTTRALTGFQETLLVASAVALACAPGIAETWRSHPYALTHYNLLAGGPAGGADLGMNRQFWGYSTRGLLPFINQHARPNAPIYWHDTNQSILNMNVRSGLLRADLGNTGLEEPGVKASDIALVIHEKHFNKYEYWIWDFYGTARPSAVLTDEGVPMVTLYERPKGP